MKYLVLIVLILILGCRSNVTTVYNNTDPYVAQFYDPVSIKAKADKSDTSVIFFTGGFIDENVKIKVGEIVTEKKSISTIAQLGLAFHFVVANKEKVQIEIAKNKFSLSRKKMKVYKFIYINKKGNNYFVEYSNTWKRFA